MPGSLTVRQARLVLPDRVVTGDLVVEDGVIADISPHTSRVAGEEIDGAGLTVLPGAIDAQVHFRDPQRNPAEDLASGSRAAAAGGITAFLDMPDNDPPCTTRERLHHKLALAARKSAVHYGFYIGATADNVDELREAERTCGIKVTMGSSSDQLVVSDPEALEAIFHAANKPIAVHAEDRERLRERYQLYDDTTDPADHAKIHDVEAALSATRFAVELATKHGKRLHVLHLTSAEEVAWLRTVPRERITCEVSPHHLFLHAPDAYERLGGRAVVDPPIRGKRHADALWQALLDGVIDCVATDHAPHPLEEKLGAYPRVPAGVPGVEWALPLLLDQVNRGRCSLQQVVRWMCEAPAACYRIPRKGRLEIGYDGDVVLVDMAARRTVSDEATRSACGWSPWLDTDIQGWPVLTAVLGEPVFRDGQILDDVRGRELTFRGTGT